MRGIGAIILAAGGSTRMGRPKQLLQFQGQSLLRRAASVAIDAKCDPIVIVIGNHASAMLADLTSLAVHPVENSDWPRGIGTSIRAGVREVLARQPDTIATFIHLCDQPLVASATFEKLLNARKESGKPVCVCSFAETIGPPVLVDRTLFPALLELPDHAGAKKVWTDHPEQLCTVRCPEAALDADTPEDYQKLLGGGDGRSRNS
ncbi:MAG TPA: nucleotidyltransferase family protein [Humisphaera sp.]|jgi:molybdenum cofactor cytidylyltransferase|nr:nucleotidyltransferase family protein [Humisphaera sp.]